MTCNRPISVRFIILFAILTLTGMALFFNIYEPWTPIGPERIADGNFTTPAATNDWRGWSPLVQLVPDGGFNNSPGVVLTTQSNRNAILRYSTDDLIDIPAFRISLQIATHDIVPGEKIYHVPRAIFFYKDTHGKNLFSLQHEIIRLSKNTGWHQYTGVFPVPAGATNAHLHIQNLGQAGTMQVDNVSVIPVRARRATLWWKFFFGSLWIMAFILCLIALKPWTRRYGYRILLTITLILIGIILPGELLDNSIEKSLRTAQTLLIKPDTPTPQTPKKTPQLSSMKPPSTSPAPPREELIVGLMKDGVEQAHGIGHFTLFSLLAWLTALSWIGIPPTLKRAATVCSGLIVFAAATEILQFIPPDRSAGLSDLSIDLIGMAIAVGVICLFRLCQSSCHD